MNQPPLAEIRWSAVSSKELVAFRNTANAITVSTDAAENVAI